MDINLAVTISVAACLAVIVLLLSAYIVRVKHQIAIKNAYFTRNDQEECIIKDYPQSPRIYTEKTTVQPRSQKSSLNILETFGFFKWNQKAEHICSNSPSAFCDKQKFSGKLNFGLSFDREAQTLKVHIIQALELPAKDICGKSDPYVRVFLEPGEHPVLTTRVQHRTLNPIFNQTLSFPGYSMKRMEELSLCMQMMDYDRFTRDDPIGEILLPMKQIKFENCPVYWKNLNRPTVHKEGKGELMLSLCYVPSVSKLTIVVIKARDLPAKDITGASDPYVKIWIIDNGNKIDKRKTTTKQQTLSPSYNESFVFTVIKEKIQTLQIAFTVMDYDLISPNEEIGHVIIGAHGAELVQRHWKDMIDHPGYPVKMWHKLSPRW